MRALHLPAFEYRRERWRNGDGWTREIAREPAAGEGFDWRVSIAELDRDVAYSRFDGCERWQVLLSGEGVTLELDEGEAQTLSPPHGRAAFAGERAVLARVGAPVHLFNVIARRDRMRVELLHRPLVGPMVFFPEPGVEWLLHLMEGRAEVKDRPDVPALSAGDSLRLSPEPEHPARSIVSGGGEALLVRFVRTDAAR